MMSSLLNLSGCGMLTAVSVMGLSGVLEAGVYLSIVVLFEAPPLLGGVSLGWRPDLVFLPFHDSIGCLQYVIV